MTASHDYQVVLDLAALQGEHSPERGISRYVLETTRALVRRGAPITQLGLSPLRSIPDHIPDDLLDSGLVEWLSQGALERRRVQGPTVLHVFSPFELLTPFDALYPPASAESGCATTATVYDAIPHTDRDQYLTLRLARTRYDTAARYLSSCSQVFGISQYACEQAIANLGVARSRVVHVGAGAGQYFQPESRTGDQWPIVHAQAPQVGERFVLTVGGWEPRKNIEALIAAMGLLPADIRAGHRLVQVGAIAPEVADHWRQRAADAGLAPEQLVLLGRVDDSLLRALYQTCRLFVFPSLDEGFGLPVLEAARCGAAVITSDRASVPEVLDDPASTFPADSPTAMAARMALALTDEVDRARLLEVGAAAASRHTWDAVADRMIDAWSALRLPHVAGQTRRHLALVGVFDRGTSTGGAVARQNLALAEALGVDSTVSCFDVRDDQAAEARTEVQVRPARALGAVNAATAFDDVIHLLGPSPGHSALRLLRHAPGVAVVESSGTVRSYPGWILDPGQQSWLAEELRGPDEARLHPTLRIHGVVAASRLPDGRPFGSRPLLQRSRLIITNSPRDASLFRLDLGPYGVTTRVGVLAPVAPAIAHDNALKDDRPIIVVGDTASWAWTVQHLASTLECEVEQIDIDGADPLDADRRWCAVLPTAAVVLFLDHDAPRSHVAWAAEAVSYGVPVVTTGSWSTAFPRGVVRHVDATASSATMYAHVAALAQPSPIAREQRRAADHFRATSNSSLRAAGLLAQMDGTEMPPDAPPPSRPVAGLATTSAICRAADFESPVFAEWCLSLGEPLGPRRKLWEHVVIAQALELAGSLRPGARGLGFGVGTEPLTAAFAARGAQITATDLDAQRSEALAWSRSGEHAARFTDLNSRSLCDPEEFERLVEFRSVDMNDIPEDLGGLYDFCWSSCAFEHLGSIDAGLRFVERSIATLRPGGVAVHTTELVLSSDTRTLETGMTVLFRESDIRTLVEGLERAGHTVAPLDTALGDEFLDLHVDVPPYHTEPHLKLELGGHVTTSLAIIVRRCDD